MDVCRFLRWKGRHGRDTVSEADLQAVHQRNHLPYTCLLTSQCWGPDEHPAAPEACTRERPCFGEQTELASR